MCCRLLQQIAAVSMINHTRGTNPDNKVHGANMGPIWGRQDPGEHHVGHMNFDIWEWKGKQSLRT